MKYSSRKNTVYSEKFYKSDSVKKNISFFDNVKNTWAFSYDLKYTSIFSGFLIVLARIFTLIFYSIAFLFVSIFRFLKNLGQYNRPLQIIVIAILLAFILFLVDFVAFYGRVYPGVFIGDLDLGNKTEEEAKELVYNNFSSYIDGASLSIYSDEQALNDDNNDDSYINAQISNEEAKNITKCWKTTSEELDASLPVSSLVDSALNDTRGFKNIFLRLGAFFFKYKISPYAVYNQDALNQQISRINEVLGSAVINPTCVMQNGEFEPIEGQDGALIDNQEFEDQLNKSFFNTNDKLAKFAVRLHNKKQDITFDSAQKLAECLNKCLDCQVSFQYKSNSWNVDKLNLSKWINIEIQQDEDIRPSGCSCSNINNNSNFYICALIDNNTATYDILSHMNLSNAVEDYSIKFAYDKNTIKVNTEGNFEIPNTNYAIDSLNNNLFSNAKIYNDDKLNKLSDKTYEDQNMILQSTKVPEVLDLDKAINIGLVQTISKYTTSYTTGSGTENRNHNIALAANSINNTICSANGGVWSYNDTVGDFNAENGYLEAGTIVGDRYDKSVGGGVCQVATTVFNAVYDSGYAIPVRHPHNLHMSSYPAGRDAAVFYPSLDLKWRNDSTSDILVQASTTGYSVTVSLLGVNPEYSIKTETGEWVAGDQYKQEYVVDPSKEANSKFVQSKGSDGKSISIKRIVRDAFGNIVREDAFNSKYDPKTEIIVLGPGDEANKMLEEKTARLKNENDKW